jgi:riboflavin synthase
MNSRWKRIWNVRNRTSVFTGIIEELGTVAALEPRAAGARLTVRCSTVMSDVSEGASIAVNGVCLTALALTADSFSADLAPETLERSNLGDLRPGSRVNLERPVTPVTRLSGHIVQGHVDAAGEIVALDELGDGNYWLRVRVPAALDRYLVHKGSIALDGISLTIAAFDPGTALDGPVVGVTIIPHTFAHTTLGSASVGSRINVEVDVLAKHVEKLLSFGPG